ncbi:MAG TPA: RsmG family class I SAM-dependent methyltransferase, partial [Micavibrio sp.]|nr:RsmG family class I SAM-dependent methyltransferase [Micavibrio sp.]
LLPEGAINLYDLGSGAGFAGMVLAILRPGLNVTLIESDAKKCAFLSAVSRETGTPVTIVNKRIEAARALPAPDLVTARALASLSELFGYVWAWAREKPELRQIFPKGAQAQTEIKTAQAAGWTFEVALTSSKTEAEAQILTVTKLGKNWG